MATRRTVVAGLLATPAVAGLAWATSPLFRPRTPRSVVSVHPAQPTTDGAGVRLKRALGTRLLPMLDPFLMLDEFRSDRADDYIAGFPDHPHRGFETVTIMLEGAMEHRDSVGNHGRLAPGSVQWMTAGRGIVHSEMPKQQDGLMWGYQLWVNLPARLKMTAPRYQDLAPTTVPVVDLGDAQARVLAGAIGGVTGPVDGVYTAPTLLDVTLEAGGKLYHELPGGHTAFVFVVDGTPAVGPEATPVPPASVAVLGAGESVVATGPGRLLLFAGAPIGEPVARRGPFVMNTEAEIRQAYEDYRAGRLGT
jgi:quercetin 2,3-dioxygenase